MLCVLQGAVARRPACPACAGQGGALQPLVAACLWPGCAPASWAPLYINVWVLRVGRLPVSGAALSVTGACCCFPSRVLWVGECPAWPACL